MEEEIARARSRFERQGTVAAQGFPCTRSKDLSQRVSGNRAGGRLLLPEQGHRHGIAVQRRSGRCGQARQRFELHQQAGGLVRQEPGHYADPFSTSLVKRSGGPATGKSRQSTWAIRRYGLERAVPSRSRQLNCTRHNAYPPRMADGAVFKI